MRLYLDDNTIDAQLVVELRKRGHDVVQPSDAGIAGADDPEHFIYAIAQGLVLLTRDHKDFGHLHDLVIASGGNHPGLLLVRFDNDPTRDPTPRGVATAVGRIERAGVPVANQLIVVNQWR